MKWFKVWMVVPGTDGDAENGPCEPDGWNDMVQAEDEASAIRQANEQARAVWESPSEYEPDVPGPSAKEMGCECPVCTGAQEVTEEEHEAWEKEMSEEQPLPFE